MSTEPLPEILRGATVLMVTAHPDDESYLAAGTVYAVGKSRGQVHLVCATKGERGVAHLKQPMAPAALAEQRSEELRAAAAVLGLASVALLDHPDGDAGSNPVALRRSLEAVAARVHPTIVLGFGPDGITAHLDHIAVGTVARRLARSLHLPYLRFALPPTVTARALTFLKARRHSPRYAASVHYDVPNLRIPIDRAVKERALRCHASQMDEGDPFTGFPDFVVEEYLVAEHFVLEPAPTS